MPAITLTKQNRFRRHILLVSVLALTLLLLGFLVVSFHQQRQRVHEQMVERESVVLELLADNLDEYLQHAYADLRFLAGSTAMEAYLQTSERPQRQRLAREWAGFARSMRIYDQIRLLDVTGQELVRVDWLGQGSSSIRPRSELQDKSHRYYFQEAITYGKDTIYVSPLDLNVEHGELERPFEPLIRLATPVYDGSGEKAGLLVLNYLGSAMLHDFTELSSQSSTEPALLNEQGYWLQSPDPQHNWGFLRGREELTLARQQPEVWRQFPEDGASAIWHEGHLWMVRHFVLMPTRFLPQGQKDSPASWYIVLHVPPAVLQDRELGPPGASPRVHGLLQADGQRLQATVVNPAG